MSEKSKSEKIEDFVFAWDFSVMGFDLQFCLFEPLGKRRVSEKMKMGNVFETSKGVIIKMIKKERKGN